MDKKDESTLEFDMKEVFRKLTSSERTTGGLHRVQRFIDEIRRRTEFIRELGELCMKYGVGGISELEYKNEADTAHVLVNWTYGRHLIQVNKDDDIAKIVCNIFGVVGAVK